MDVFIEPQFANICYEPLFTVRASNLQLIKTLELDRFAEHKIELGESGFLYTVFAYSWHLEHLIDRQQISQIPFVDDVNERPLAFCWRGQVSCLADIQEVAYDDEILGDIQIGYCLYLNMNEIRSQKMAYLTEFRLYPLYRYPTTQELNTVWVS